MTVELSDIETSVQDNEDRGAENRNTAVGQSDGSDSTSIVGAIRRIAESETKKVRTIDLGVVTSIFPHSSDSDDENYYCSVRLRDSDSDELRNVPIMTPHIGLAHVPNIGDLVVVGYIGGNVNSPVVLGSLYNDEQRPPRSKAGESIYVSPDDRDSKLKRLYFRCPSGTSVLVKDDMVRVSVGKAVMTMRSDGEVTVEKNDSAFIKIFNDGSVFINSQNSVALSAKTGGTFSEGSVNIDADQYISLTTQNDGIRIKSFAGEVSIEAQTELKLKAPTITLEGVNVKIDGSASTEVKGGVVKIN